MQSKYMFCGMLLIVGFAISGCANNRELITKASLATRNDVFGEIVNLDTQHETAIADIKFDVKSNSSRFMEMYKKHSNPPYRTNVNIDGQALTLETEPVLEETPFDASIPESGTGWKYQFNKRIVLAPGKHKLTIALPADDVIVEREVELQTGVNSITVIPLYNKRFLRPYKGQNFTAGVKTVNIAVN